MSIDYLVSKRKAIELRKNGLTYSEILKDIPVAKSTLSLWLRSVDLTTNQKQRITTKRRLSQLKGAKKRKTQRIATEKKFLLRGREDIGKLTDKELLLVGSSLYWAEGSKQNEKNRSQSVIFSNSDPRMILTFLKFLKKVCQVKKNDITFELYIHKTINKNLAKNYWSKALKISPKEIRTYLKQNKIVKKKRKINKRYCGMVRVRVKKSTNLNRKISGWIEGIRLGVV